MYAGCCWSRNGALSAVLRVAARRRRRRRARGTRARPACRGSRDGRAACRPSRSPSSAPVIGPRAELGEQPELDRRQQRLRRPEPHADLHDAPRIHALSSHSPDGPVRGSPWRVYGSFSTHGKVVVSAARGSNPAVPGIRDAKKATSSFRRRSPRSSREPLRTRNPQDSQCELPERRNSASRLRGRPARRTGVIPLASSATRPKGDSIAANADPTSAHQNPGPHEAEAALSYVTPTAEGLAPFEVPPEPTAAERQVADLIPIETDPETARAVLDRVPLWFHTFSLDRSERALHPRRRP